MDDFRLTDDDLEKIKEAMAEHPPRDQAFPRVTTHRRGLIEALAVQVFCSMVSGRRINESEALRVLAQESIRAARILADELDNEWGR